MDTGSIVSAYCKAFIDTIKSNIDFSMERVRDDKSWTLFDPTDVHGLIDAYGANFATMYAMYEGSNLAHESISARVLWSAIIRSQIETGGPFMLYKDACNGM